MEFPAATKSTVGARHAVPFAPGRLTDATMHRQAQTSCNELRHDGSFVLVRARRAVLLLT